MKVYGLLRNSVQISNKIKNTDLILYKLKRESKRQKNAYGISAWNGPVFHLEQRAHREHTMSEPRANHLLSLKALKSSERPRGAFKRLTQFRKR